MNRANKIGVCMIVLPLACALGVGCVLIPHMATAALILAWFGTAVALILHDDRPDIPSGNDGPG